MTTMVKSSGLARRIVGGAFVFLLLIPVAAVAILAGANAAQRARIERIAKLGGCVNVQEREQTATEGSALADFLEHSFRIQPIDSIGISAPARADFDEFVANVAALHTVRSLYFEGSPLTDRHLELLSRLRGIKMLDLQGSDVTNEGLPSLARCDQLEALDLRSTAVSDRDVDVIASSTSLRFVDLRDTRISDDGAERLRRRLPSATVLSRPSADREWRVLRDLLKRGATVNGDRSVVILAHEARDRWSDFDWKDLQAVEGLASLYVGGISVDSVVLEQISEIESLRELSLMGGIEDARDLRRLTKVRSLQFLKIDSVDIDGESLAALLGLPELHSLFMRGCKLDNSALGKCTAPLHLEKLGLFRSNLTDTGMRGIANWKQLKYLEIADTQVTDASLDSILALPELEEVLILGSKMSANGTDKVEAALTARAEARAKGAPR